MGMERDDSEAGEKHDLMTVFKTRSNYNYCAREHLTACSFKRGELSGAKEIRDGQGHTNGNGVPFSKDLFEQICRQVWKKDDSSLTAEQLV
ncbi:hypothetical protein KFL_007320040 [Klebsormidium nitens]|uniref:Uncharacterized protein n=1 Tax=Klebsormidium nitens TaxID=105231 RepID=A0A1Y1IPK4_KLENI|nr:hypothetical protein KFL_007320040 [Klebsormidium nitens]|eukprot:GAQ91131.1 hypothetical protein KFL_007320040 [Klebsormidium nitens]